MKGLPGPGSAWPALVLILVLGLAAACDQSTGGQQSIEVHGALYVDFHTDAPCEVAQAPAELSGVDVVFRGPGGTVLGRGTTGDIAFELLDFGEGKRGWNYPGCRYYSGYRLELIPAERYEVSSEAETPEMVGAGSWFSGVNDLEPLLISHAELEAQGFALDIEVAPSYVVVH